MYSVSENYISAVRANTRTDRLLTTLTLPNSQVLHLTDDDYGQNSIKINWQCVDSEELMFGAAYTTPMDISIRTNLSRYQFYGAVLEPVYEVKIGPDEWYPIPLGVFTVSEATRVGQLVQMTAYDNMQKFDMEWSSRIVTGTPYIIVKALCDEVGVDMATQETDMENWPNCDLAIQLDETNGCSTLRDGIKYICQLVGAFARINRTGALELVRFHTTPDLTLTDSDRYSSSIADYSCSYIGLSVTGMAGTYTSYASGQIDNGLLMVMSDAAAWDAGAPRSLQTRTDRLFAYLQTIEYVPADVTMPGDPSIECGDMITLEVRGDTLNTIVTSVSWAYRGQMSFGSVGQNPYFAGTTSSAISSNRILSLQGEQNKNVLYSYKNAEPISVGSTFHDICRFAFATLGSTDCLFCMTVILDVTANSPDYHDVVLAQSFVDDNGQTVALTGEVACEGRVTVDFQYLLQNEVVSYFPTETFTEGRHTYILFFPIIGLSSLLAYTWRVQMKCTGGTVAIAETNLHATLWGQRLNDREIPWDGILLITEQIQAARLATPTIIVTPIDEDVATSATYPEAAGITESIGLISLVLPAVTVKALSESVIVGRKSVQIEIVPTRATEYTFDSGYLNVTPTTFTLRTDYTYLSEVGIIDSGVMKQCEVDLTDFSSASAISATATGEEDSRLPAEYQEVEYIDSTTGSGKSSGQYIDTGITLTSAARVVIDTAITPVDNSHWAMHGVGSGTACFSLGVHSGTVYYGYNSSDINTGASHTSGRRYVYDLDANNRTYKVHDTVTDTDIVNISISAYTGGSQYKFYIGRYSGGSTQYVPSKVYSCKIYDGSSLVADYVPCYRKSDNEIGLYDLVSHTFKTNSGTGTYTKGADVIGTRYKTLIADATDVYTVSNSALANVDTVANLTAQTFIDYGFANLTDIASAQTDILALDNVTIMRWVQSETMPSTMAVSLTAVPNPQGIIATTPLIDVIGLNEINATYSGNPLVAINVDNSGWICYNSINEQWEAASDDDGMSIATMQSIPSEEWETLLTGASSLKVRLTLATTTDSVTDFEIVFVTN